MSNPAAIGTWLVWALNKSWNMSHLKVLPYKWIHLGRRGRRWKLYKPPGTRCRQGRPRPGWSELSPGGGTNTWSVCEVHVSEEGWGVRQWGRWSMCTEVGLWVVIINGKVLLNEVSGSSRQGVLFWNMMDDSSRDAARNYLVSTNTVFLGSDQV